MMKINILHTNDLHGHLENWPIIREYLKLQRAYFTQKQEPFLLVDIGDALDTVHPMVEASQGEIMVDLFNEAGYDIVTIGNNEGLNFTNNQLDYLYSKAEFEVTLANLLDSRTYDYPRWANPLVYREIEGQRIALIGLTAPYATYTLNEYELVDPFAALEQQLRKIQQSNQVVDLIIVLSHLGLKDDRLLAQKFPQIDLIIGGHTHHVLLDGEEVHNSTLAAAGKYGHYVGHIELELLPNNHQSVWEKNKRRWKIECHLATIEQLRDLTEIPISDSFETQGRQILRKQPVAHLPHYLSVGRKQGTHSFIKLALDAICESTHTQIGLLTTGLFLSDLSDGLVTENDLHEALPHSMHLIVMTFTGKHLLQLLEELMSQEDDLRHRLINGMGFRGKIFGEFVFKGVSYDENSKQWFAGEELVEHHKVYRVAAVDHYWFLPFFPTIADYGSPQLLFPAFLRHVVADYLRKYYPLNVTGKD